MTLPANRFNALCDTRQFLLDLVLAGECAVATEARDRAASLLQHYPTDDLAQARPS